MSKKEKLTSQVDLGRGVIKDNILKAMVTSKIFQTQVEQVKKGKGSFKRHIKHAKAKYGNGDDFAFA